MRNLKGIAASPGVVIGKAFLLEDELVIIPQFVSTYEKEEPRLLAAVESTKIVLNQLREKTLAKMGADHAQIFEAHLMILEDPELLKQTLVKIKKELVNAEKALEQVSQKFI